MTTTTTTPRLRMVCAHCGGTNVGRDAYAEWDEAAQRWTLGTVFDNADCQDCEGETSIIEQPTDEGNDSQQQPAPNIPALVDALAWALDQVEDDLDPCHGQTLAHCKAVLEAARAGLPIPAEPEAD